MKEAGTTPSCWFTGLGQASLSRGRAVPHARVLPSPSHASPPRASARCPARRISELRAVSREPLLLQTPRVSDHYLAS